MGQRGWNGSSPTTRRQGDSRGGAPAYEIVRGPIFVRRALLLSTDHDALHMKSKRASRGLGLSLQSNAKKGGCPVQTTVYDSQTGIVLSSRYAPCGESVGDTLLLAVLKLVSVEMVS
jgi:hypothetical protein